MSTNVPIITTASIPTPTDDPASLFQSILAIKQNIEGGPAYPRITPYSQPSSVNTAINAALRAVNNAP